jgi:hypothetical protein
MKRALFFILFGLTALSQSYVHPANYTMKADSTSKNVRLIYGTVEGKNYKGKSYFFFKDGIGYVVNFMATPGTFDKNLPVFEQFIKNIRFPN